MDLSFFFLIKNSLKTTALAPLPVFLGDGVGDEGGCVWYKPHPVLPISARFHECRYF